MNVTNIEVVEADNVNLYIWTGKVQSGATVYIELSNLKNLTSLVGFVSYGEFKQYMLCSDTKCISWKNINTNSFPPVCIYKDTLSMTGFDEKRDKYVLENPLYVLDILNKLYLNYEFPSNMTTKVLFAVAVEVVQTYEECYKVVLQGGQRALQIFFKRDKNGYKNFLIVTEINNLTNKNIYRQFIPVSDYEIFESQSQKSIIDQILDFLGITLITL